MQIIIKCIKSLGAALAGNDTTSVNVDDATTIADLKKKVEKDLKIAASQQTLIFAGSPLQDDRKLADYPKIKEGTKLYLVVKKQDTLPVALNKFLRQYYSEDQCKIIENEFMRNFRVKVDNMSLDDLERIAVANLNEEC